MENEKKYKCCNCSKVLFVGNLIEGTISKDCPKCKQRNVFRAERRTVEVFECVKRENPLNSLPSGRLIKTY